MFRARGSDKERVSSFVSSFDGIVRIEMSFLRYEMKSLGTSSLCVRICLVMSSLVCEIESFLLVFQCLLTLACFWVVLQIDVA